MKFWKRTRNDQAPFFGQTGILGAISPSNPFVRVGLTPPTIADLLVG